ncbi:MAG: FliM/FliN family flagellar motor switch protein [Hyphomicrobiales bacterium]|nr:FliM/FliN family flagellar motor switch protein [Hyphomicrobiales bacterium]
MSKDQDEAKNQLALLEELLITRRPAKKLDETIVAHLGKCAILWNEIFRNYTQLPIKIALDKVENVSSVDALPPDNGDNLFIIMGFKNVEAKMIAYIDRRNIGVLNDLFFGNETIGEAVDGRPITNLQKNIAQFTTQELLRIISDKNGELSHLTTQTQMITTKLPLLIAEGELGQCFHISYAVNVSGEVVNLNFLIPEYLCDSQCLLPPQQILEQQEVLKRVWEQRLKAKLASVMIRLDAVLDEKTIGFSELLRLQVGQVLALNSTSVDNVKLEINSYPLMQCQLGKVNGNYTLRIDQKIRDDE